MCEHSNGSLLFKLEILVGAPGKLSSTVSVRIFAFNDISFTMTVPLLRVCHSIGTAGNH